MDVFQILPALGATKAVYTVLKGMFKGYKKIVYFAARWTSPPTSRYIGTGSLRRRGEHDPENLQPFSIGCQ